MSKVSSAEIIETLWEFLRAGIAVKEDATKNVKNDKVNVIELGMESVEVGDKKVEDNLNKIECDVKCETGSDVTANLEKNAAENAANIKGAGQLAKEFFKILHESVSFKYSKSDEKNENSPLLDSPTGDKDVIEAAEDCNEEKRNFDRKISNIVDYFFNIVKSPKGEGAERVRRKSSCFWTEQSPSDFDSRQETVNEISPDEDTKIENLPDDKMETLKEFLSSPETPKKEKVVKESRKSLDMQKNQNVKIQRKIFSKRSSSSEEKQSLLEYFFDHRNDKRRKGSNSSRISLKKQKSLEENSSRTIKPIENGEVASTSGERRGSLVDLLFKKDKSVNFSTLLRRFSQDSSEICYIDESPEMKTKETFFVDLVLKCMDSFDSYVEPLVRKESLNKQNTISKVNMLLDSKAAIAIPENFQLTPDREISMMDVSTTVAFQPEIKPALKDMGTSCDISDSLTQYSAESEITPTDAEHYKEEREEFLIEPDQLQELRKCAEVIFKEVQGQQENSKLAGISVDICDLNECPECKAEAESQNQNGNANNQLENEDDQQNPDGCDQCRIEAILLEAQLVASGTLETNFEYNPRLDDDLKGLSMQMDNLTLPFYRGELEMINESFEAEDSS